MMTYYHVAICWSKASRSFCSVIATLVITRKGKYFGQKSEFFPHPKYENREFLPCFADSKIIKMTIIGEKRRNFGIFVLTMWSNEPKLAKNREEYGIICKNREVLGFFFLAFS